MAKTKQKKKLGRPLKRAPKKPVISHQLEMGLLIAVLLLTFGLRMIRIDSPLLDFHSHRQTQTASNAFSFAKHTFNFFQPRFGWTDIKGNAPAVTEMEFPVYQYILGMTYRVTGVHDFMGRLLSIFFGLGITAYVWIIARRYFGLIAAVAAALFYAVDPVAVFFNRTYQPDTMALFFFIGGFYYLSVWFDDRENRNLIIATAMTALSLLIKPPVILILVPWIIYEFINRRLWEKPQRADLLRLCAAAFIAVGTAGAWYIYTYFFIFKVTGMTIMRHPVRTTEYWFHSLVYTESLKRIWLILTPIGALMLGAAFFLMWRDRRARIFSTLVLGHFLYFILIAEYNLPHYYYQLPLIPIAAVCIGWLSAKIIEWGGKNGGKNDIGRLIAPLILASAFISIGAFSYRTSNPWYNIDHAPFLLHIAQKTNEITGPEAIIWANEINYFEFHYYSSTNREPKGIGIADAAEHGVQYVVWLKYQEWDLIKSLPENSELIHDEQAFAIWKLKPKRKS